MGIAEILSGNPCLTDLTLPQSKGHISTTLPLISTYLTTNSTLLELSLSNSSITGQDFQKLVQPLKNHPTLKMLNLDSNSLQNDGIKMVSEIIQYNSILKEVDVYNNKIGEEGALYLLLSIQNFNTTLLDICIWGNDISQGLMEQIEYSIGWNVVGKFRIVELESWSRKGVCDEYREHVVMLILVIKVYLGNIENNRRLSWTVLNMLKVTDIVTNPRCIPWSKNTWKVRGNIKKIRTNPILKDDEFYDSEGKE